MVSKPQHVEVHIAVQQNESSQFAQAIQLCQKLIKEWSSVAASDIEVGLRCVIKA